MGHAVTHQSSPGLMIGLSPRQMDTLDADALAGGATPEWAEGFAPIWQQFVRDLAAEMGKAPQPEPLPPAPAITLKRAA